MKSKKYSNVNMRGSSRTTQEKAICVQCQRTYNAEKFLNKGICYQCCGYTLENVTDFLKSNEQQKKELQSLLSVDPAHLTDEGQSRVQQLKEQ